MRRASLIAVVALAATLFGANTVAAGAPNVGSHIHIEIPGHPTDGHPIPRVLTTLYPTIRLHDQAAKTRWLRLDDSSTPRLQTPLVLGPCADCSVTIPFSIDFGSWSVGRHELRWHVDISPTAEGKRQYTTSRAEICLESCSPNNVDKRPTPFLGGGSWYTGPGYVVALLKSDLSAVHPGATVAIASQYGGATACAYLNPDFHHGSHGRALGCGSAATIPFDAAVGDKFVIVAAGRQEAGVLELRVNDGSDQATAFLGAQSWWLSSGLVLP